MHHCRPATPAGHTFGEVIQVPASVLRRRRVLVAAAAGVTVAGLTLLAGLAHQGLAGGQRTAAATADVRSLAGALSPASSTFVVALPRTAQNFWGQISDLSDPRDRLSDYAPSPHVTAAGYAAGPGAADSGRVVGELTWLHTDSPQAAAAEADTVRHVTATAAQAPDVSVSGADVLVTGVGLPPAARAGNMLGSVAAFTAATAGLDARRGLLWAQPHRWLAAFADPAAAVPAFFDSYLSVAAGPPDRVWAATPAGQPGHWSGTWVNGALPSQAQISAAVVALMPELGPASDCKTDNCLTIGTVGGQSQQQLNLSGALTVDPVAGGGARMAVTTSMLVQAMRNAGSPVGIGTVSATLTPAGGVQVTVAALH